MFWFVVLAAAAAKAAAPGASGFEGYRACITDAMKKAATSEETPEDLVVALPNACLKERGAMYLAAGGRNGETEARVRQLLAITARRYAVFYSTGVWTKE